LVISKAKETDEMQGTNAVAQVTWSAEQREEMARAAFWNQKPGLADAIIEEAGFYDVDKDLSVMYSSASLQEFIDFMKLVPDETLEMWEAVGVF
jgi:hypothetical protein